MKTLKICLVILCLLPFRVGGLPQFDGANFFMKKIVVKSPKHGVKEILIDDFDYDKVVNKTWSVVNHCNTFYAKTHLNGKRVYMHRLILDLLNDKKDKVTDHKDRNGLNNQRENLRITNQSNNLKNRSAKKNGLSKYLGVSWHSGKWRAFIIVDRKFINLGRFVEERLAAKAYDEAAKKYHGEFANPNFK